MSIIKAKRFPYESYIFGWYLPEKFCNDVLRWHKHNWFWKNFTWENAPPTLKKMLSIYFIICNLIFK